MGDEQNTDNVVRFPKNWVGPVEELVPIGPRARAREADEDASVPEAREPAPADEPEEIPAAGDFWGEGAAALHHAIRAPAVTWDEPCATADTAAVEPSAAGEAATTHAAGSRPRPRLPQPQLSRRFDVRRPRFAAVAVGGACLAAALVVVILLALPGGGRPVPHRKSTSQESRASVAAFRSKLVADFDRLAGEISHEAHVERAREVERRYRRLAAETHANTHRRERRYMVELRKRRAATHQPVSSNASPPSTEYTDAAGTNTTSSDAGTEPSATEATPETSEASTSGTGSASAATASSSQSAPAGPTGVGGSTGGCNPQCR